MSDAVDYFKAYAERAICRARNMRPHTLEFVTKAYRDDLTIQGGVLRDECSKLYYRPWDKVPLDEQGNR